MSGLGNGTYLPPGYSPDTSSSSSSSSSGTDTQTAFAVIAGVATILVACVVFIFYFTRDRAMVKEIIEMQRRFDLFKVRKEL